MPGIESFVGRLHPTKPGLLPARSHLSCRSLNAARSFATQPQKPHLHQQKCHASVSASSSDPPAEQEQAKEEVEAALRRAQQAFESAQIKLEHVDRLPSARIRRQLPKVVRDALQLGRAPLLLAVVWASHCFGPAIQAVGAVAVGMAMAVWGRKKGALSPSGAASAFCVGAATLAPSFRCGVTLLAFYASSSKITAFREEAKAVDEAFKEGGQRDWKQVCCNALIPAGIALAFGYWTGGGFLGYYACFCGDTWVYELGQLSEAMPRLITSLRPARKGTNGGVTLLGLAASVAGGLFTGMTFYAAGLLSPTLRAVGGQASIATSQWALIPIGLAAGLFGSILDSVLGATVQFSGFNRTTSKVTSKQGADVVHISGSLGGVAEACCLQPIDVIKTRLQLDHAGKYKGIYHCGQTVIKEEGVKALWKGLTPFATHLTLKYALRMGTNAVYQGLLRDQEGNLSQTRRLMAGFCAGITEALVIVTPFEVVKIRLQQQKGTSKELLRYKGPVHAAVTIVRTDGLFGLWAGATPTVLRNGTNQMCLFWAKNNLDRLYWGKVEGDGKQLTPLQSMASGFSAAVLGPCATGPFDVIKTRLMAQEKSAGPVRYRGLFHALVTIPREEGIRALWRGLLPRLMRIPPGQAIVWAVSDQITGYFEKRAKQDA
ncbi:hypothetical protein WJX72_004446 [[Myrmecia] bisecta]|uniref:Mitochondrial carrier protein n=1 Tax=[Myrmecia] bisecta TaxID=41462 RepID=A0AAW1R628_9CHLO